MRLNIVTRSLSRKITRGPGKVLKNTLKGLELNNFDYSVGTNLDPNVINWIHDSPLGLIEAGFLDLPVLVGPNVAVLPFDLPKFRLKPHSKSIFLFPSLWPMQHWERTGFSEGLMKTWASGVDIECFPKIVRSKGSQNKVLIYFKNRDRASLDKVLRILTESKFEFEVLEYGCYGEQLYKKILSECLFAIWVSGSESQGYAMLEAMATGMPIIVCDINKISDNVNTMYGITPTYFPPMLDSVRVSAAPYFDERCGYLLSDIDDLPHAINRLLVEYDHFDPSGFVSSKFSLKKSALDLIEIAKSIKIEAGARGKPVRPNISQFLRFVDLGTRKTAWSTLMQKVKNKWI